MNKIVHYALTSGELQEGINGIVRRTIFINNDDTVLDEIIKDINVNGVEIITNKNYDNLMEIEFGSIDLHYYIENEGGLNLIHNQYLELDYLIKGEKNGL
jgi:hypothetical protein